MIDYKLGELEMKFADLIWNNEPISSGDLVKLATDSLVWKKPTTYTVLRKLCEKGFFKNENSSVTSLISKDEYMAMQSEKFVEETFSGSLPKFLAAFSKRKDLSDAEVTQIQELIDRYKEGK
ncbi:MAG: BlaI/MecI/CopY family transcriptional regulator [Synergistaceae bacterium]|jgi:BlaI family penicillinase repressor|nr:BlaI/MecI/CopY family transcriptional regulator [Synergistaceae bacterium]